MQPLDVDIYLKATLKSKPIFVKPVREVEPCTE